MGSQLDRLFQEWHRLGGAVLLAEGDGSGPTRSPEEVIAESTTHCRESGRLTWVVLDWLLQHIEQIDEERLLRQTEEQGDLSVLGVLCDAAQLRYPHPKFERTMVACAPHDELEPFFHRVARSALASKLTRENALAVFRRWNYLCAELRYLESKEKLSRTHDSPSVSLGSGGWAGSTPDTSHEARPVELSGYRK